MITIKTPQKIEILRAGGKILASALEKVRQATVPGVSLSELNKIAQDYLVANGGRPSFLGYGGHKNKPGFPTALCASVNDELVHGSGARDVVLKEGDIIGLDLGVQYPAKDGLYTDMAITVGVGQISKQAHDLINITRESLYLAIEQVKPGNYIHDISKTIQQFCEKAGYSVIRDLSGHGVGYAVHEDPSIPDYYDSRMPKILLKEGMVICIEPMVAVGGWRVKQDADGWTIRMADGGLAAHFEHTIVVVEGGYEILTEL